MKDLPDEAIAKALKEVLSGDPALQERLAARGEEMQRAREWVCARVADATGWSHTTIQELFLFLDHRLQYSIELQCYLLWDGCQETDAAAAIAVWQQAAERLSRRKTQPMPTMEPEDGVLILQGPFRGFSGSLCRVDEVQKQIVVRVNIFGRDTLMEVPNWMFTRLSARGMDWFMLRIAQAGAGTFLDDVTERIRSAGLTDRLGNVAVVGRHGEYALVLTRLDEEMLDLLGAMPGCKGLVGMGDRPTPVPTEELRQLLLISDL